MGCVAGAGVAADECVGPRSTMVERFLRERRESETSHQEQTSIAGAMANAFIRLADHGSHGEWVRLIQK